jgi:lysozyme
MMEVAMRRRTIISASILIGALAFTAQIRSQQLAALTVLSDEDVPRRVLAEAAARLEEPGTLGLGVPFRLPQDARPEFTYGIDISHYTFSKGKTLDWDRLDDQRVSFVYMKATEGARLVDGTFKSSWAAATSAKQSPLRGAYHFLRADEEPEAQAEAFLKVIREQTDFKVGRDLPPAVDLEWDCKRGPNGRPIMTNGRCAHDNWTDYSPSQIADRVDRFLKLVESKLGVTPVVYTAAQWWSDVKLTQLSSEQQAAFLTKNPIWIADYSSKSQKAGKPRMPAARAFAVWQFTDNGKVTDTCDPNDKQSECTDTNVVMMSDADFRKLLGLSPRSSP